MRAGGARGLAALDPLASKPHLRLTAGNGRACPLQTGAGQHQETPELMLIEIPHRVEEIAIEGHGSYATSRGANNRVIFLRSVSVQASGGVIRSA